MENQDKKKILNKIVEDFKTVGFSISGLHDTSITASATKNNDSFFIIYFIKG